MDSRGAVRFRKEASSLLNEPMLFLGIQPGSVASRPMVSEGVISPAERPLVPCGGAVTLHTPTHLCGAGCGYPAHPFTPRAGAECGYPTSAVQGAVTPAHPLRTSCRTGYGYPAYPYPLVAVQGTGTPLMRSRVQCIAVTFRAFHGARPPNPPRRYPPSSSPRSSVDRAAVRATRGGFLATWGRVSAGVVGWVAAGGSVWQPVVLA